jgi:DNA repair protein RecN (Recombination protein N)
VDFQIKIEHGDLTSTGKDVVSFMFSANKGMALRPVAQVASGGEIARLMLSLKALISATVKLPTIIFDEIDTGVSGKIAEKMAEIMKEMGNSGRQVISITHLPQIAALGTYHYKVEKHDTKEITTTIMRQLSNEERIDEIAQMLSGSDITDAAKTNAKELLKRSK